jgi:hypothetical protein
MWDTQSFIKEAVKVHGNRYDYSDTYYTNSTTKVEIVCKEHGKFLQTPSAHIHGRQGCMQCGYNKMAVNQAYTAEDFVKKAKSVHGDKYDYSLTEYKTFDEPVTIICPIHGEFLQKPVYHLGGSNCQKCAEIRSRFQFDPNKPTTLYYIHFYEHNLYKIGITNRSIQQRFSAQPKLKYKVLASKLFEGGYSAWKKEQSIISNNLSVLYDGPPVLYAGNSELFTENILDTIKDIFDTETI